MTKGQAQRNSPPSELAPELFFLTTKSAKEGGRQKPEISSPKFGRNEDKAGKAKRSRAWAIVNANPTHMHPRSSKIYTAFVLN